jgi:hypothetical protein
MRSRIAIAFTKFDQIIRAIFGNLRQSHVL